MTWRKGRAQGLSDVKGRAQELSAVEKGADCGADEHASV